MELPKFIFWASAILIGLVCATAIIWYEIRPTQIRKQCAKEASSLASSGGRLFKYNFEGKIIFSEAKYYSCLHQHGI